MPYFSFRHIPKIDISLKCLHPTWRLLARISESCRETHADGTLCENWKKEPV